MNLLDVMGVETRWSDKESTLFSSIVWSPSDS